MNDQIIKLYTEGVSMRRAAMALGVSYKTVRTAIANVGLARRPGIQTVAVAKDELVIKLTGVTIRSPYTRVVYHNGEGL